MDIDYKNSSITTFCYILMNVTTVLSFGKVLLFKVYLEPDSKHMYHIITAFNKIHCVRKKRPPSTKCCKMHSI